MIERAGNLIVVEYMVDTYERHREHGPYVAAFLYSDTPENPEVTNGAVDLDKFLPVIEKELGKNVRIVSYAPLRGGKGFPFYPVVRTISTTPVVHYERE